jgi:hypothetical protein
VPGREGQKAIAATKYLRLIVLRWASTVGVDFDRKTVKTSGVL